MKSKKIEKPLPPPQIWLVTADRRGRGEMLRLLRIYQPPPDIAETEMERACLAIEAIEVGDEFRMPAEVVRVDDHAKWQMAHEAWLMQPQTEQVLQLTVENISTALRAYRAQLGKLNVENAAKVRVFVKRLKLAEGETEADGVTRYSFAPPEESEEESDGPNGAAETTADAE